MSYIKFGFDEIAERVPPELRTEIRAQHDKRLAVAADSGPKRRRILTKVASALDVFHPPTMAGASVELATGRTAPELLRSTINLVSSSAARGFPIPEQAPELRLDPAGLVVEARPMPPGIEHHVEFAFYLFRDCVRVESRWYEEAPTMRFSVPATPGQYSATSFMRKRGAENPVWVDRTAYVLIETLPEEAAEAHASGPAPAPVPAPELAAEVPTRTASWARRAVRGMRRRLPRLG
ncbi:hypothetical protein [Tessaracoccus sp. MC1756]|uniref:hypothetical protein n=1 Tax=Tessaracoccus sp. MC1756 TaxID=2760311 RepID=UPI00160161F4|nr:hypothetical protein [Tessaracoccus sp. MC1756]MBB1510001.1 hypothetical protein [Tessaracoccus sp. MC1756]